VVAFEISFLPLALIRRTRPLVAASGIVFHMMTRVMMRIGFVGLWGCYVVLFDWGWLGSGGASDRDERGPAPSVGRAWILGPILALVVFVQGARDRVQAWPFACYPTFQYLAGDAIPDVVMTAVRADGSLVRIPQLPKSQAAWGTAWAVAGVNGTPPTEAALRAYRASIADDPRVEAASRGATTIRFTRGWFAVAPEAWGQPPRREDPLGELTLSPRWPATTPPAAGRAPPAD
jgi:hypothetical protein